MSLANSRLHASFHQPLAGNDRHRKRFCLPPVMPPAASSNWENAMAGKSSKSNKPTHEAFVVTAEGESAFWTKLGAVWPHDDGKGFNVELIALPLTGKLVIWERKETKDS
jgi:hypothetical protein